MVVVVLSFSLFLLVVVCRAQDTSVTLKIPGTSLGPCYNFGDNVTWGVTMRNGYNVSTNGTNTNTSWLFTPKINWGEANITYEPVLVPPLTNTTMSYSYSYMSVGWKTVADVEACPVNPLIASCYSFNLTETIVVQENCSASTSTTTTTTAGTPTTSSSESARPGVLLSWLWRGLVSSTVLWIVM